MIVRHLAYWLNCRDWKPVAMKIVILDDIDLTADQHRQLAELGAVVKHGGFKRS